MYAQLPEGGRTLVYSTVVDHKIKLDYYLPRQVGGDLPTLIYYHGGGMTAGSRRGLGFPHWLYDHCQKKGWIFISADYRLCHPSTALDQIDDAKALLKFLASEQFKRELPQSVSVDTARIAVTGFSAGAYSARAACIYAEPKPAVLLSVYGLGGNMLLDHWTKGRPPTSIAKFVDLSDVPALLADKTVVSDDISTGVLSKRFALTVHWEIEGTFLDGCFGRPGLGAELDAMSYEQRFAALPNDVKPGILQSYVTKYYPPSVFVHGLADEVVSPQESIDHYEQLTKLGVNSELHLVKDGPHGLQESTPGSAPEMVKATSEAYNQALDFITNALESIQ